MLSITPLPAFNDNYIWLIRASNGTDAIVVDPGDAAPVIRTLESQKLRLVAILITHHHHDHTGGIPALRLYQPDVPVYGPSSSNIPLVDHPVADGERFPLLDLQLRVLSVPGHTLDHLAFYCAEQGVLFCGDTLFAAGCGRLFEGSPAMMFASLARLAQLPPETRVYCAHEYTSANLRFAAEAEPDNAAITARQAAVATLREQGIPSVPSTIAEELATNPFLRCSLPTVQQQAARAANVASIQQPELAFAALRAWKDRF